MADFYAKSQVIFFTHYGRVAERAKRLDKAEGGVFCLELD
jgi:hypothetical protein